MPIRRAAWSDLEDVADLLAAQRRVASGIGGARLAQLRSEWERTGFVVGRDNLVVEEGGLLVGYAAVSPTGDLALAANGETAGELLEHITSRARERGHDSLVAVVDSDEGALASVVRQRPFALDREILLMWRPLGGHVAAPQLPDGITLRTFEEADGPAVHLLLDEAYASWDARYAPTSHSEWVRWMTGDPEFDADVWWLAERDGTLAGCALHWSSGWLKDLAVSQSERGRGLGAALVQQGLYEFAERGVPKVGLKVDAANPTGAVHLYEKLGFVISSREATWRLPL